jgi:hypothetical protein
VTQDAGDAQGAQARLRNKQTLLDLLCERVRDQSSYTRCAVLQTWAHLAEHRAIPLGHWQMVTGIATGAWQERRRPGSPAGASPLHRRPLLALHAPPARVCFCSPAHGAGRLCC